MKVSIDSLSTTRPVLPTGKQIRQNSLAMESAKQLYEMTIQEATGAHMVFVEVPIGSQSARAMASYGICVGVLGSLRANMVPLIEVTPTEVKLAATNNKNATKDEMIQSMVAQHPAANWPWVTRKNITTVSASKAEHMADACAAIHAGIKTNTFQQLLSLMRNQNAN